MKKDTLVTTAIIGGTVLGCTGIALIVYKALVKVNDRINAIVDESTMKFDALTEKLSNIPYGDLPTNIAIALSEVDGAYGDIRALASYADTYVSEGMLMTLYRLERQIKGWKTTFDKNLEKITTYLGITLSDESTEEVSEEVLEEVVEEVVEAPAEKVAE